MDLGGPKGLPFPFAWYQVTQGVSSAEGQKSNIAVATQVVADKDGIAAAITVNAIEIDGAGIAEGEANFASRASILQLIGFDAEHNVVHKYYNGTTLVPYAGESGKKDFAVYKITIQTTDYVVNQVTIMTAEQISTALRTKEFSLSVVGSHEQLDGYFVEYSQSVPAAVSDNATTISTYTVPNNADLTSATSIAYLVVYAKGNISQNQTETNNGSTVVSGTYTVSLSYTAQ